MNSETIDRANKLQRMIKNIEISLFYLCDDKYRHHNLGRHGLEKLCKGLWEDDFCMGIDQANNLVFGIHGKVKENMEKYLKYKLEKYREELDSLPMTLDTLYNQDNQDMLNVIKEEFHKKIMEIDNLLSFYG